MDPTFLNRNVNEGFSGGEKKRNEILQLAVLEVRHNIRSVSESRVMSVCSIAAAAPGHQLCTTAARSVAAPSSVGVGFAAPKLTRAVSWSICTCPANPCVTASIRRDA